MAKQEEAGVVVGIPYENRQYYYVAPNPHQNGAVPPNAIFDDPKGVPITQTIFRDTPAPFTCAFCSHSSLTSLRSKVSVAAFVGCMMPMMLGFCFLCPSMDCLWHKYHYCPSCGEKVGEFQKSDMCAVMDPPNWEQKSFALTG
ncbi:hypothetical protein RND81_08G083100 [Saponaria officinalis]|uniref:LITAF domain-containing protein n=1 Tax=Saponaria officinalis TaxID=3572 RepID=A0AAW1J466_SAPOF